MSLGLNTIGTLSDSPDYLIGLKGGHPVRVPVGATMEGGASQAGVRMALMEDDDTPQLLSASKRTAVSGLSGATTSSDTTTVSSGAALETIMNFDADHSIQVVTASGLVFSGPGRVSALMVSPASGAAPTQLALRDGLTSAGAIVKQKTGAPLSIGVWIDMEQGNVLQGAYLSITGGTTPVIYVKRKVA